MPKIESLECFIVDIPRNPPYLGSLAPDERINEQGYFVRKSNRTIYPISDRSLVVRLTTDEGHIGYGETYGITAPRAVGRLIRELIEPIVVGSDPFDAQIIWEDLYDLQRVRGYTGGFWLDAIAAVDIAMWDVSARAVGLPLCKLLGGQRHTSVPAYISGLSGSTCNERQELASQRITQGFNAIKLHAAVLPEDIVSEVGAIREAIGPSALLMLDLHWMFSPAEAIRLIRKLDPFDLAMVEAPTKTEDVNGLAWIADHVGVPIAAGEEWRTVFDARTRIERKAVSIVQPEMGHCGVTQFMRISHLAHAYHLQIMPHATIGSGIFMAASLQASASLQSLRMHEYQPTIFDRNAKLLNGIVECAAGHFALPEGPGLGVVPNEAFWEYATPI
jgi:galactonate dehydratase